MRRGLLIGTVVVVVLAAIVGGVLALRQRPARTTQKSREHTVVVGRGPLRQAQTIPGRLGYADARTVAGVGDGMITWLPSAGVTVDRGGQLFRVDDAPVTVFYGDMPLYRTLAEPTADDSGGKGKKKQPPALPPAGHDVDLVAANLAALGFWHGSTTGLSYNGYLVSAVKAWQESLGEEATGEIALGSIVMTPGPVRVLGVLAQAGTPAAQDIVKVTGTSRSITLQAPPRLAQTLAPGRRIKVRLANGTTLGTRVTHVGAQTQDGHGQPVLPVQVRPIHPTKLRKAASGSVSASLVTAARKDVLQVPVNALLALAGGGYALERPKHELVPVTIGLVADGRAEVKGIEAGAHVVVAQ